MSPNRGIAELDALILQQELKESEESRESLVIQIKAKNKWINELLTKIEHLEELQLL